MRKIKSLADPFPKKYEAHHILCVSPVSETLLGQPETSKIYGAVGQTDWCINNKKNMLGMPLWGHTVKYYCQVTSAGGSLLAGAALGPPPWAHLPQHDIDHNSKEGYTWEVEKQMERISAKVEKASHALSGASLAAALDSWSAKFEAELKRRATRKGGTYNAWKLAQAPTSDPQWSQPFSMASDGKVSSPAFPVRNFNDKVQRWISKIAGAITGGH